MGKQEGMLRNLYLRWLVPSVIGMLGGTVNVLFDGILTGLRLGETGIASVNQSMPVYLMLCTVGSLIAAGASACSAEAAGGGMQEEAERYYGTAMEAALVFGGIFCFLGVLGSGLLAGVLGSAESREMVETYIRITFFGGIFKILLYMAFFYLRLRGKAKQAADAMLVMAVANIALDYVFLFWLDLGIAGAAWASVLATAVACGMGFGALGWKKGGALFTPVRLEAEKLLRIVKNGSPMAVNNLLSAVRLLCLNQIMDQVGGSTMVAVFGITNSINEFSICIQNGVPQAASAMQGIYYGERDQDSIRTLLWLQLKVGAVLSACLAAGLLLGGREVGALFGVDQDLRFPVACLAVSIILGTINSVMTYYYYSIMKPGMANLITVLRVFAVTVPMAYVMRPLGDRIWLFYWTAEGLTFIIWIIIGRFYANKNGGKDLYFLEPELFGGTWIRETVACNNQAVCEASEKIQSFCGTSGFSEEQAMTIGLAMEELMVIVAEKAMENQGTMDVRIYQNGDGGILRIRFEGKSYNPLEYAQESLEYLGVQMIINMAKKTEYQSMLGFNTLIVSV